MIAIVVLTRDLVIAEDITNRAGGAIGGDPMLVAVVVVGTHYTMMPQVVCSEEVVLCAGHSIVHQVLVDTGLKLSAVVKVQRKKAHLVAGLREPDRQGLLGMVI